MTPVTPKLERYVSEVRDFQKKHAKWPTIAELALQTDRPRQVVHKAAKKLEDAGLVVITNDKPSRVSVPEGSESVRIPKRWWRVLLCEKCQIEAVQPEGKKANLQEARVFEALGVVEAFWAAKKRLPTAAELGLHILIPKRVKNAGLRSKVDTKKFIAGGHMGKKNRSLEPSSKASGHRFLQELAERGLVEAKTGKPKRIHAEGECLRCSDQIYSMGEHQQHLHDMINAIYGHKKFLLEKSVMEFHVRSPKPSKDQIKKFLLSLPADQAEYVNDEGFENVKESILKDFAAKLKKSKASAQTLVNDEESADGDVAEDHED